MGRKQRAPKPAGRQPEWGQVGTQRVEKGKVGTRGALQTCRLGAIHYLAPHPPPSFQDAYCLSFSALQLISLISFNELFG